MINEVLVQPKSSWNCSEPPGIFSQARDSWVELYNTQARPLDLYAAHAEISLDGGTTWSYLPFGSAIAPGGFLVIFPVESQRVAPPTTWTVVLVIGGVGIDQAAIPLLQPDQSYARVPDGSSTWQFVGQPTIDASNNGSGEPATPTPTKTPKPTKTPLGGGATGSSGANIPVSSGTQPAWNEVQLPQGATPMPAATGVTVSSNQLLSRLQNQNVPVSQSGGQDNWWQNVVFVVLGLLLLTALFWGWRFFHAP